MRCDPVRAESRIKLERRARYEMESTWDFSHVSTTTHPTLEVILYYIGGISHGWVTIIGWRIWLEQFLRESGWEIGWAE